jgi:GAF domain-containing protein
MLTKIGRLFAPPVFEGDEDKTRAARLLNVILLTILVLPVVLIAWLLASLGVPTEFGDWYPILSSAVLDVIVVILLVLLHRGYVAPVSAIVCLVIWGIVTIWIYLAGGIRDTTITGYFLVIAIAGLLLGGRAVIVFGALCVLASIGAFSAQVNGLIVVPTALQPLDLATLVVVLVIAVVLLRFSVLSTADAFARARHNAQELGESNRELEAIRQSLEQRVAERTRDLERRSEQLRVAAVVARDAATARELGDILSRAVSLIRDRFGFYHAGVFLVDDVGEYAVLRAATGEPGRRMLEGGHRLKVGEVGIVGHVAGTGRPRIVLDVGTDAVHFDNPQLPETRSEMALPLRVGGRVIGVLDVQSEQSAAFDEEDMAVVQTMADQLAVAIENARLLQEMQQAMQEMEAASGRYTRQTWREVSQREELAVGYRYRRLGVEPAVEHPPEAHQAWVEGQPVVSSAESAAGDRGQGGASAAVPIKLRDQVIGVFGLRSREGGIPADTLALIENVADRLALALENARLLEETQRHAVRDRLIAGITARVRASMHPETILRTAVRELGEALGTDRVVVQLTGIPGTQDAGDGPVEAARQSEEPPDTGDEMEDAPQAVQQSDVPAQIGEGGAAREKGVEG